MHLTASPAPLRCPSRSGLRALACAFMVTATFSLLRAGPDAGRPTTPPAFPDEVHVPNGCYLSTAAYLAKFTAAHPAEFASPLTIEPKAYGGPHTVALVSWENRWWIRDEFLGVVSLDRAADGAGITEQLRRHAQTTLDSRAGKMSKRIRNRLADSADLVAAAVESARDVATGATLLPFPSEQFRVQCADREIALLFFCPAPGRVAVYDPLSGTATAETATRNGRRVVELVAARLGYQVRDVSAVRGEFAPAAGVLVAATSNHGGLAR
jgi:hypothetical protein